MNVALYARVSTAKGQQDVNMQLRELREYCQRRGLGIYQEYTDTMSGAKEDRPGLNALMRDAALVKFKAVIVYRFDRFARSLQHLVRGLNQFQSLGIDFISLHEQIDTTSPHGRLVFGIMASIAEFERDLICQRINSGLAHARAKGTRLGARPQHAHKVSQVHGMKNAGAMARDIAKALKMSKRTVYRLLAEGVPDQDQADRAFRAELPPAEHMPDGMLADQTP